MEFDKAVGLGQVFSLLLASAAHDLRGQVYIQPVLKHTMVGWCWAGVAAFFVIPSAPYLMRGTGLLGPPCPPLAFCILSTLFA